MRGNSLVPFLEGLRAATPSGYSAGGWKRAKAIEANSRGNALATYFITIACGAERSGPALGETVCCEAGTKVL